MKKLGTKSFLYFVLTVFSFVTIFPMLWMLLSSLKTTEEVFATPITFFPSSAQWSNFSEALSLAPFGKYIFNSFTTAIVIVIIQLFLSSLLAYALTQMNFKGRNLLFFSILGSYMLPVAATYVPSYIIISRMGLMDTLTGLIVSNTSSVFAIFLLRQEFSKFPKELIEAARCDGANDWTVLWKIMVPFCKTSLISAGLISFIGNYNNYLWPSLITNSEENYLISVGLNRFFNSQGAFGETWPKIMAATVLSVVPLLILFSVLQKRFMNSISDTGIKG